MRLADRVKVCGREGMGVRVLRSEAARTCSLMATGTSFESLWRHAGATFASGGERWLATWTLSSRTCGCVTPALKCGGVYERVCVRLSALYVC